MKKMGKWSYHFIYKTRNSNSHWGQDPKFTENLSSIAHLRLESRKWGCRKYYLLTASNLSNFGSKDNVLKFESKYTGSEDTEGKEIGCVVNLRTPEVRKLETSRLQKTIYQAWELRIMKLLTTNGYQFIVFFHNSNTPQSPLGSVINKYTLARTLETINLEPVIRLQRSKHLKQRYC